MRKKYVKPSVETMVFQLKERMAADCRMWGDGLMTGDEGCTVQVPYTDWSAENGCIPDNDPYGAS